MLRAGRFAKRVLPCAPYNRIGECFTLANENSQCCVTLPRWCTGTHALVHAQVYTHTHTRTRARTTVHTSTHTNAQRKLRGLDKWPHSASRAHRALAFRFLVNYVGRRFTLVCANDNYRFVALLHCISLLQIERHFVSVDLHYVYWHKFLPIVSDEVCKFVLPFPHIPFHGEKTGYILFFCAGSVGTNAASCRHTLPQSIHCTVALELSRTFRVSYKCFVNLFLRLCIFPPLCQSLQCFFVSIFLRDFVARFLLRFLLTLPFSSSSAFFCHYVALSIHIYIDSNLFLLRPSVLPSLRPYIFPSLVSLFPRPYCNNIFVSSKFPSTVFQYLKFFVYLSSYPFAHTFPHLNHAPFSKILSLFLPILLLLYPFDSPLFRHSIPALIWRSVPAFLRLQFFRCSIFLFFCSSSAPSPCPYVLPFFFWNASLSIRSSTAPPFSFCLPLLCFSVLLSLVPSSIRISMSPSLHSSFPPSRCLSVLSSFRLGTSSSFHLIAQ